MRRFLCLGLVSIFAGCVQHVSLGSSGELVASGVVDVGHGATERAYASGVKNGHAFWSVGNAAGTLGLLLTVDLSGSPEGRPTSVIGGVSQAATKVPTFTFDDVLLYVADADRVTSRRQDAMSTGTALVEVCGPSAFDVDADAVYCLSTTDGTLIREEKSPLWAYVPKPGDGFDGNFDPPTPTVVLATGQSASGALRVDDTHVYYQDGTSLKRTDKRAPGTPEILATLPDGACKDLFLAGDYVYCAGDAEIVRMPKSGGQPSAKLADKQAGRAACDGESIFYPQAIPGAGDARAIVRVSLAGGAPEQVVVLPPHAEAITGISIDDDYVYWTGTTSPALYRAPK